MTMRPMKNWTYGLPKGRQSWTEVAYRAPRVCSCRRRESLLSSRYSAATKGPLGARAATLRNPSFLVTCEPAGRYTNASIVPSSSTGSDRACAELLAFFGTSRGRLIVLIPPALRSHYRLTEAHRPTFAALSLKLSSPSIFSAGDADEDKSPSTTAARRDVLADSWRSCFWPGRYFSSKRSGSGYREPERDKAHFGACVMPVTRAGPRPEFVS